MSLLKCISPILDLGFQFLHLSQPANWILINTEQAHFKPSVHVTPFDFCRLLHFESPQQHLVLPS